ncbi:hypothetical protein D3C85_1019630 [compost metagenome]
MDGDGVALHHNTGARATRRRGGQGRAAVEAAGRKRKVACHCRYGPSCCAGEAERCSPEHGTAAVDADGSALDDVVAGFHEHARRAADAELFLEPVDRGFGRAADGLAHHAERGGDAVDHALHHLPAEGRELRRQLDAEPLHHGGEGSIKEPDGRPVEDRRAHGRKRSGHRSPEVLPERREGSPHSVPQVGEEAADRTPVPVDQKRCSGDGSHREADGIHEQRAAEPYDGRRGESERPREQPEHGRQHGRLDAEQPQAVAHHSKGPE